MVVLFLNLIAMALSSHNQSELRSTLLFWLDVCFTTIFTGELTFKLVVVGPAVYFDNGVLCVRACATHNQNHNHTLTHNHNKTQTRTP